ncbi:MAG: Trk system potassium transporter TrkA [Bacteroidetes bacterium]|nr:Trk system potassium transporter TrkA [Bacteroidota bacterium]
MNIIIAGDGEVGFHLAKILSEEDHNITIVDPHKELLDKLQSHTDIMTITGDSTHVSVLESANARRADLLISVVHSEYINLLTCIVGKKLGAKRTIARIYNQEYLTDDYLEFFKKLGVDDMVCPERIAAQEIAELIDQTAATEIYEFADGKLSLFLIYLDTHAHVLNKSLNQIAAENPNLTFRAVAIHRKSQTIIPKGDDVFLENDLAYVITMPEGINHLLKLGGKEKIEVRNMIIAGGGRTGRSACRELQRKYNIKLIEINEERCEYLSGVLDKTLVIRGDARDIQLLEDEGIRDMDAFVALTDSSETNILTCLHARKMGVKRTIALVENIDYIDLSQHIGINTIVNKKLITASHIARYTKEEHVTSLKMLSGIDAEVLEFVVKPHTPVLKKPIARLNFPQGAIIAGIIRKDKGFIALGSFQIEENDKVVVFALPNAIHKVEKFFE